jgi:thioesterase domain-containing protein
LAELPAQLAFVDLSHEADPKAAAVNWQQQRVQRPFQLDRCLYDSVLLKLADHQYIWFLNQHHLITDASSFFLIAKTVLGHYQSLRCGELTAWDEKPTFARYAASLQQQQASSRAAKSRSFWQEKLAQKPEPLCFYGRSPHKTSGEVQRWVHTLDAEQTARLIALAESADLGAATAELRQFCLMATLFFSLLHQLTGNARLGLVTTIHNRATQVNRQTVGVLMELCPVLVTIEPEETFVSLLQKVVVEMKQLLLHYRYGASQTASDLALDVMFTFVQRPSLALDGRIVTHEIVHPGCGSEQLGLHVHHLAHSNSYDLYLDFQLDSFTTAEQAHAQDSLKQLIAAVIKNPDSLVAETAIPWPQAEMATLAKSAAVGMNGQGNGRTRPAYLPPSNQIESQLQQIWEEILEQSPIGMHDDFFALGGESWRAMNFLSKFEAATGYYLPLGILLSHSTIAGLAQQIEAAVRPEAVIQIQPGMPNRPALFIVPGAAGNTLAMDRLAKHMAPDQPVYTFQMPMLDSDHLPAAKVEELSGYYLEALQKTQPHGPYYLSGYSAGGMLAYEVAQQLKALGESVNFLGIIDMPAPNFPGKKWQRFCHRLAALLQLSSTSEEIIYLLGQDFMNRAIYFVVRGFKVGLKQFGRLWQRFWQVPLRQKWHSLRRVGQEKEAVQARRQIILRDMDPSGLTDPRARALFDLYDRAVRKYLPQPYDGRLTLLRCPLGYGRKEIRSPYPHYGWQHLVRHLETHTINANGHLALLHEPAVAVVGQTIQTALSQAIEIEKEETL